VGTVTGMSDTDPDPRDRPDPDAAHARDEERIEHRSELLPEEEHAGSEAPHAQAEAILAESDERTDDPSGTRATYQQTPGSDEPGSEPSDTTQLND
jgi:hypothetical protein